MVKILKKEYRKAYLPLFVFLNLKNISVGFDEILGYRYRCN
jgi:hypothetical protein